jgi:hypothetical protein
VRFGDEAELEQTFLRVFQSPLLIIIPQQIHTHISSFHRLTTALTKQHITTAPVLRDFVTDAAFSWSRTKRSLIFITYIQQIKVTTPSQTCILSAQRLRSWVLIPFEVMKCCVVLCRQKSCEGAGLPVQGVLSNIGKG